MDISELGARVELPEAPHGLLAGDVLNATLNLGRTIVCPVRFRVVHLAGGFAGLEFLGPSPRLRTAIRTFFQPELTGSALSCEEGDPMAFDEQTLRFGDRRLNSVELRMKGDLVQSMVIRSETMPGKVEWAPETRFAQPLNETEREKLLRMVANIRELEARLRARLEAILIQGG